MKYLLPFLVMLCSVFFSMHSSAETDLKVDFNVSGVSNPELKNVELYLAALDVPRHVDDADYLFEVKKSASDALTVFGYYQPQITITTRIEETLQHVSLTIDKGVATTIKSADIAILGEGKSAPIFVELLQKLDIKEGMVLQHNHYESAKSSLKSAARRYGYFDAKFTKSTIEVSALQSSAHIVLWFDTGRRYQFGELVFNADLPAEKFIISLMNFKVGEPFDRKKLSTFNIDLSETGYFKSITILPVFSDRKGLQVPLQVIATTRPTQSFNVGLGVSTDEGIRGKLRWNYPWVNQYGHSIEANLVGSIPKQEASLTYKVPLEDPLYNYLSLQTGYKMVNQNDTDTTQYVASVNRHWRLDNGWMRTVFLRYDMENGLQGQQMFNTKLLIPGISFSRTRAEGGINILQGDKLMTSLEVSNEWWLSTDDLVKIYGQAKIIRTYSGHQFVGFSELGAIQTDSIYNVPSSMRFFSGGDQSIRGFGYDSISPQDDQGYLIGGKYLALLSLEYRLPVSPNWKVAAFYDTGTVTNDFSETLSSSTGLGVVWASPVGPVRLYFAHPLTNSNDNFSIHFMIGPEL